MFLINHRSQGDFFIHPLIVGGKANFLARYSIFFLKTGDKLELCSD